MSTVTNIMSVKDGEKTIERAQNCFAEKNFVQAFKVLQTMPHLVYENKQAAFLAYQLMSLKVEGYVFSDQDILDALQNAVDAESVDAVCEFAYFCETGAHPYLPIEQDLAKAYVLYERAKDLGENLSDKLKVLKNQLTLSEESQLNYYRDYFKQQA